MSSSLETAVAELFLGVIPIVIFLYATYWSVVIRRALVVRIYRNHALALGVLSALIGVELAPTDQIPYFGPLQSGLFILVLVGLFAFVDSTIPVARRSDPLLRQLFHWNRIRKGVWVLLAIVVASWVATDYSGVPPQAFIVIVLPVGIGVPALLIGSRRSGDPLLRSSLKWVGLAILFFGASIVIFLLESFAFSIPPYGFNTSYAAVPSGVFLALAAYSFYRSARSLVPLNRISLDNLSQPLRTETTLKPDSSLPRLG